MAATVIPPHPWLRQDTTIGIHRRQICMASISHTIGNIPKEDRRCPRKQTQFLLGYLPVTKLKIFGSKKTQQVEQYRLFHRCMKILLGRLYDLKEGELMEIVCGDSLIRRCYLFLLAYVADHPEQCLVACCKESRCPTCDVKANDRGREAAGETKDTEDLTNILRDHGQDLEPEEFDMLGLRSVCEPFWAGLRTVTYPWLSLRTSFTRCTKVFSRNISSRGAPRLLVKGGKPPSERSTTGSWAFPVIQISVHSRTEYRR